MPLSKGKKKQAALHREAAKRSEIIHTRFLSKSESITHQNEDSDHWHLSDCYSESESESDVVIIDCNVQQVSLVC